MINILYLHVGAELYGADVILLELVKNLDKTKYNPYVVLPCDGPLAVKMKENGINVSIINYPILRRQYFNIKGIFQYLREFKFSISELEKFCIEKNIELIHSNTVAVLEGATLWRRLKVKHVWHIHEMLDKPKIVYKFLGKIMSKRCDKVLAVSNAVKEHWKKTGYFEDEDFEVIHNGIDLNKFNPHNNIDYLKKEFKIKDDEKIVGFIGRINAIKGQEVFFQAMEEVMSKTNNVKALIAGDAFEGQEWRVEELKEHIKNSPFKDRFIYSKFRMDSCNLHCLLDVFVLSSISYDSFPTVVLEAMASAKPVVSFKSGGVSEMITHGKTGYFAKFGDKDDLAKYIYKLVTNEDIRKSMGNTAYNFVNNKFTSQIFKERIQKFYDKLMSRSEHSEPSR